MARQWHSLRQRSAFLTLQKQGHRWVTPSFVINASCVDAAIPPQIGFTVTKKLGNAVVRNRIKRRLRAVVDEVMRDPQPYSGWSISFLARASAETHDAVSLAKDLRWALRKLQPNVTKLSDDPAKADPAA